METKTQRWPNFFANFELVAISIASVLGIPGAFAWSQVVFPGSAESTQLLHVFMLAVTGVFVALLVMGVFVLAARKWWPVAVEV